MNKKDEIKSFEDSSKSFITSFKHLPDDMLSYHSPGEEYSLGGLLVHVIHVMKYYKGVLEKVLTVPASEELHCSQEIDEETRQKIHHGIEPRERNPVLGELIELHSEVLTKLADLEETAFEKKRDVYYEGSDKPYPTSPADILIWLKDHYTEHATHLQKILSEKK